MIFETKEEGPADCTEVPWPERRASAVANGPVAPENIHSTVFPRRPPPQRIRLTTSGVVTADSIVDRIRLPATGPSSSLKWRAIR